MLSVWSTLYLEQDVDLYNCYLKENMWKQITSEFLTNRIFARITNGHKFWICSVGQPIRQEIVSENEPIFVPSWILEQIHCDGSGSSLDVEFMPSEAFDNSESILLLPEIEGIICEDIQTQLSVELTKLGILQKNTRILVNLSGMDTYFQVKNLNPASVVLCQGDEVVLEFDSIERAPSPYPFDVLPEILHPIPSAPSAPRFNPWRNKDFKPNIS